MIALVAHPVVSFFIDTDKKVIVIRDLFQAYTLARKPLSPEQVAHIPMYSTVVNVDGYFWRVFGDDQTDPATLRAYVQQLLAKLFVQFHKRTFPQNVPTREEPRYGSM